MTCSSRDGDLHLNSPYSLSLWTEESVRGVGGPVHCDPVTGRVVYYYGGVVRVNDKKLIKGT